MTEHLHKHNFNNNTERYLWEQTYNNFNNNTQVNFMSVASLAANTIGTETFDISTFEPNTTNPRDNSTNRYSEYTNILIFGECGMTSVSDTIGIFISANNNDFYKLATLQPKVHNISSAPTSSAQAYHFTYKGPLPCRFVKIANTSGNAITNLKVHLAFMKK